MQQPGHLDAALYMSTSSTQAIDTALGHAKAHVLTQTSSEPSAGPPVVVEAAPTPAAARAETEMGPSGPLSSRG